MHGPSGDTDIENRLVDLERGVGRKERVDVRRDNMESYTTVCKVESQWEFAVWLSKLKLGLCDNLEGWEREGRRGKEIQDGGDICILMAEAC